MPAISTYNWWALAIRGVVALIFGVLTLMAPGITVAALVYWFGAYALIDGVLSIIAAWRAPDGRAQWGSLILEGITGILAGVLTFFWPAVTAITLIYLIAGWSVITGIFEVVAAIRLRRVITGEWALILMGLISIGFGLMLAFALVAGALAIAMWIGIYAIIFGVMLLVLAFRMRHSLRSAPITDPAYGH